MKDSDQARKIEEKLRKKRERERERERERV